MHLLRRVPALAALLPSQASAAIPDPAAVAGLPGATTTNDFIALLISITEKVLDFIILVAIIFVIVAGIRLIVSGGDEGQKDAAKKTIIHVIVGLIIVLLARVMVLLVNNIFG